MSSNFSTDNPEVEFYPRTDSYPFSEAVRVGNILYLAGQLGMDASGKLVAGGVVPETIQTMENIKDVLERHGSSLDDLIDVTVAIADMAEWPAMNEVYRKYFTKHFPARNAFGANGLALGARVEMTCKAVVR